MHTPMTPMPESYDSICRKKGFLSETLYNLPENPHKGSSWYQEANLTLHSTARGIFQLYYALRSFPSNHNSDRYNLFLVTRQGIFVGCNTLSPRNEPLDFQTVTARFYCDFRMGDFITLIPNTRQIIVLKNYRFTELINGKGVPSIYDYREHPEPITSHKIYLESDNFKPLELDFNDHMLEHLKRHEPYIWLKENNYIAFKDIRFNRQPY